MSAIRSTTSSFGVSHLIKFSAILFAVVVLFFSYKVKGADTLSITLQEAEKKFLDSNYLLLAQKYNIEATRALIIQAKVFPNPNYSHTQTLYNSSAKRWFPVGFPDGEVAEGISQLILLAGKRNNSIKLAKANTTLSEYQFYDLIRTLKYTLRSDFFDIYFLQRSAAVYEREVAALQKIVEAYDAQKSKAYIAEKDVVRVKAQLYSLQSEYNDLMNQINDKQSELRLILQVKHQYLLPVPDTLQLARLDPLQYPVSVLIDSAYHNRTDLKIAKENTEISRINLKYQKSLAVPDVSLNFNYDQQGSYIHNLSSIGLSFDLPVFNRNQGNIKSAKYTIDNNLATQRSVEAMVEENVYRALEKANDNNRLFKSIDKSFAADFDRLTGEIIKNYMTRNIGLLEFLDFYDAYKQNILQLNTISYNRVQPFEDINYYTATNFFN